MKNQYDYVVVGAGITGATIAQVLSQTNHVLVIEKRPKVGGNCADFLDKDLGIYVHEHGAHIFHTNYEDVWKYITQFTEMDPYVHKVQVNYNNKIFSFPINFLTVHQLHPNIVTPFQMQDYLEKQRTDIQNPMNLTEQCTNLIGKELYEIFIKGYTEKQWGMKCEDLSPELIKRIPVRLTSNDSYFCNDRYCGIPHDGYTSMIERMLNRCDVIFNTDWKSIISEYQPKKKIIYTGPIDEFFEDKKPILPWRSLRFETSKIVTDIFQPVAVMNYTSKDIPFTRIIEHKHFMWDWESRTSPYYTIITKEYPQDYHEGLEKYYPINNEWTSEQVEKLKREIPENYIFCGRLAEYKYYDMDKAVKAALDIANLELATNK